MAPDSREEMKVCLKTHPLLRFPRVLDEGGGCYSRKVCANRLRRLVLSGGWEGRRGIRADGRTWLHIEGRKEGKSVGGDGSVTGGEGKSNWGVPGFVIEKSNENSHLSILSFDH